MDYELAKKLKDAGFPQEIQKERIVWYTAQGNEVVIDKEMVGDVLSDAKVSIHKSQSRDDVYIPSLSELLDACPNDGTQLIKGVGGNYHAEFMDHSVMPYKRTHLITNCATPEIAIAKLWLELKK